MRSSWRVSVVTSLSILAIFLCATSAGGIGDSTGKSVDELIDESNGIFSSASQPRNPQEARDMWSQESGIDFTPPGNQSEKSTVTATSGASGAIITGEGVSYQTASSSDFNPVVAASAISTSSQASGANMDNAASTIVPQSPPDNVSAAQAAASVEVSTPPEFSTPVEEVAGNWTFRLRDSKSRVMALNLYQSENAVFGTGSINDGGESMRVSASGSLADNRLALDATSSGTIILYRMALTTDGRSASGEYRAFSNVEPAWSGTVEGTRV